MRDVDPWESQGFNAMANMTGTLGGMLALHSSPTWQSVVAGAVASVALSFVTACRVASQRSFTDGCPRCSHPIDGHEWVVTMTVHVHNVNVPAAGFTRCPDCRCYGTWDAPQVIELAQRERERDDG